MALPDGAIMCSIREYYFDWRPDEPATFTIEYTRRIEPRTTGADVHRRDRTKHATSPNGRSCTGTSTWSKARDKQVDNTFGDKIDVPRGLQLQQFGFCFYDLAPDEALVLDFDVPDARYWSLQLYKHACGSRPYDIGRITSLNHAQVTLGADGRIQVVVAHDDPGVPNWLDTEGRAHGSRQPPPLLGRRSCPSRRRRSCPPPTSATSSPPERPPSTPRHAPPTVRARRDHLAWRFRT